MNQQRETQVMLKWEGELVRRSRGNGWERTGSSEQEHDRQQEAQPLVWNRRECRGPGTKVWVYLSTGGLCRSSPASLVIFSVE